jgi:hypothetical protein
LARLALGGQDGLQGLTGLKLELNIIDPEGLIRLAYRSDASN